VKIYLGGPINGCSDAECKDWRAEARRALAGHEIIDPMARDYRGREDDCFEEIVRLDKHDISYSDVLLMNCPKPSVGTSMEILFGYELGKRVYIVAEGRISPWLRAHGKIYPTVAAAIGAILA
jgi:hypothetical protein